MQKGTRERSRYVLTFSLCLKTENDGFHVTTLGFNLDVGDVVVVGPRPFFLILPLGKLMKSATQSN